jgi:hypothetical protein
MILESAQLLCTAHRVLDGTQIIRTIDGSKTKSWVHPDIRYETFLYSATHINHPCAIWVRESTQNYFWVYELMIELNREFVRRYNKDKDHATIIKLGKLLANAPKNLPDIGFTVPPRCMPLKYHQANVVLSYRAYYRGEKREIATWTNCDPPEWFIE